MLSLVIVTSIELVALTTMLAALVWKRSQMQADALRPAPVPTRD
jgi:hypothetical protein